MIIQDIEDEQIYLLFFLLLFHGYVVVTFKQFKMQQNNTILLKRKLFTKWNILLFDGMISNDDDKECK